MANIVFPARYYVLTDMVSLHNFDVDCFESCESEMSQIPLKAGRS